MIEIVYGEKVTDGAGVKLNRVIGTQKLDNVNPFLLLDEFRSDNKNDYIAGFPMHPHRGFDTITYMIEGKFTHKDSKGHQGSLNAGEVQWMTAGKGIIHEEMPAMENGTLWGYQLWVNLPAKEKMIEPKYRHLTDANIPLVRENGTTVKIISGDYHGTASPIELIFPVNYFDVRLDGGIFEKELRGSNLIYVHTGKVTVIADRSIEVTAGNMAIVSDFDKVHVEGNNSGFLFMSANPINEPIARYGPFVMNTTDEIIQAIDDANEGTL